MRYIVILLLTLSQFAHSRELTKVNNAWAGTWNITGGGSYSGAPLANDTVIIGVTCTIPNLTNAVCKKLEITAGTVTVTDLTAITIGGDFSMTGGILTLGSALTNNIPFPAVSGTISLTGGTVSYAAATNAQVINTNPTYFILNINRNSKSIASTLNVASNLTFTTSAVLTTSANINVAGAISGSGSLVLGAGVTLDVKGSVSSITLTCDATSTVNYSGSGSQTGRVTTYGNLVKNGTANTLTIASGFSAKKIQVLTGNFSMANCTILSAGDVEVANGATLTISGSFPNGYGSTTLGSTSTINYTGGGNIEPLIYGNLSLTSTSRTVIGNTTVNGNLALTSAYLILAPSPIILEVIGNITGSASSTIESNDGYLSIGGLFTAAITFNTSTSSTVNYSGISAAQTIVPEQYNNLILSGSADKTLSSLIQIDGTFTSTTSGTISAGTSTVEFNSSNDDQIIPAFTFYILKVSNANKVLAGNVIVNRIGSGALFLNGTTITTGSFDIRVLRNNADAITFTDLYTDYIIGNLSRNFTNGATLLFPLGDPTLGSLPLQVLMSGLTVGSGTGLANGFLTVSSTVTDPTTYTDFPGANFISTDNACNRYWTISNSGFTFTNLRAGLKFFNPDDLGSAVVDPLNFLPRVNKSGVWTDGILPDIATDTATVSGLTLTTGNSMDIWLGEKNTTYCASKITPANWNSPTTWTCNKIPTSSDTAVISLGHLITLNTTSNFASYLQIDGTAVLAPAGTATVGNIGNKGILISSTGAITRTSGTPTLSSTGNLVINNSTAIPATVILAMAGTGDSIKTNQASLAIPKLAINSNLIYNTVPNLTVASDLTASLTTNVLNQASGTILTLSDASTNITMDASASNAEVIYNKATSQTINKGTYYNLTLTSTTAPAKTSTFPAGATIVTNELKLQTGSAVSHSLNMTLATTTLTGTGALFTMGSNTSLNLGDITLATAINFPSTFSTYAFDATSIVNYNTNGSQTVSGTPTYKNLNITTGATSATKTLGANTTVELALTIANGTGNTTLSLGTNTLNIAGTISGTGTLTCPTNSTVNYNSGSAQAINLAPSYYNFTTSGAGTKTSPSGTLLVAGSLTTNGTLNTTTNSTTVDLNGASGSQNISGTNTFFNLSKTGASTIGSVTGTQTINNLFSISSGSGLISPNGNITIIDGASLLDNNATSSFTPGSTGYVVVQKSAASANKSYLLSGPISSYTSATLDAGQGKQVLRFDTDGIPTNIATVYKNACSPALKQNGDFNGLYKATTGTLEVGKGYSVLQATAKNLSFLGNVNNGTISFSPLSSINRTTPDGSGFNWCTGTNGLVILGNPYPSAIDWASVYASATGINTSVKIWNGTNYTDVSQSDGSLANRAIKTGQGFILQVSNFAANSLSFQNAHRISNNNGSLLRTESSFSNIKIELTDTQNEEFKDVLSINFNEKATDGFDAQYDSYDLPGISDVPSLVAVVNGNELSTTEFPSPTENKNLPVLLSFNNESDYEVKVANSASLPNNMKVYLVDQSKKTEYDLSESTVLPFKKGSFVNYEVQLRTTDNQTQYTTVASSSNKAYSLNDKIVVENNNDNLSDIAIYDVTGKLVLTKNSVSKGKYEIELSNKNQIQMYIVKLSSNTTTNTYKVILY